MSGGKEMDLDGLRDSLDSGSYDNSAAAQAKLTRDFKAAALHLTTLYRNSLSSSKDSFREGYLAALNDVLLTLGERKRITGHAGSSRDVDLDTAVRPWESAQEQLEWLERYLRGRTEAMRSEPDGDDDSNPVPPAPPSTIPLSSNGSDEHRRGRSPPMSTGLREQPSEAVGSPFRAPTDSNTRTPMHSMRLRNRNIDSSSAAPSPTAPRSRSVTSSNVALSNEGSSVQGNFNTTNAAPIPPNASFTFHSERPSATSSLGFSQFQTRGETGRISGSGLSAAASVNDVKKKDAGQEETNPELRELEAQLDAQRVRQGNGNGKGMRRSAPIDIDAELLQASLLDFASASDMGHMGCAAQREDASNANSSTQRVSASVVALGGGSPATAFASSTGLPHEKKRVKLETERKVQQFRDHHQFGKKRRDR